jgi:hypothetical protein
VSSDFFKKSSAKSKQTFVPSADLAEMNRMRAAQARDFFAGGGGLGGFAGAQPGLFRPSAAEQPFLNSLMDFGRAPGQFSMGAMSPLEQQALDPTRRMNAARGMLEGIVGPALLNQLTASGLGRSGAGAEALTNAGLQMALPIEQSIAQGQLDVANRLVPRALQGLMTGREAAGATREGDLADFLRRQGLASGIWSGLPTTQAGTTRGKFTEDFTISDIMQMITSLAGAAGMANV